MVVSRARIVSAAVAAVLAVRMLAPLGAVEHAVRAGPRFKAVAFDYFVLFNADSIVPRVESAFPGQGRELTNLWRTRQFEYGWLRSMTGRYADFLAVTRDALLYATSAMHLELTPDRERRLLDGYLNLEPWPDTVETLRSLERSGVRVVALSNFSPAMLRANAEHAHVIDLFDALVSTDENRTYKPDPRAYQLAVDRLHLAKSDILFAAFAGWDAAGAKSFGYQTYWVNRLHQPRERLDTTPDAESVDLEGLLRFVLPPRAE